MRNRPLNIWKRIKESPNEPFTITNKDGQEYVVLSLVTFIDAIRAVHSGSV